MERLIDLTALITNEIHDLLIVVFKKLGYNFTDKQLHFIIIGVLGIIMYLIVNQVFKAMAKISIEVVSFIYTFTVLVVIVFAIEIEQKITGRGVMEFNDIVAGLWGFIYVFSIYVVVKILIYGAKRLYFKYIKKENDSIQDKSL